MITSEIFFIWLIEISASHHLARIKWLRIGADSIIQSSLNLNKCVASETHIMNLPKTFLFVLVNTCAICNFSLFSVCTCSASHFNFLIITVSNTSSISAEAMAPGFSVAFDEMALKYPSLYRNFSVSYIDIAPPGTGPDTCTPVALWMVTERISQLYGSGELGLRSGTQIILTPGKKAT
jgi:hypothetical protein